MNAPRTKSSPFVIDAHGKHAHAAVFSPDSRLLVSAGQDAKIRLWKVPGFEPAGAFAGHRQSVNTLSLAANGAMLASSSTDGTARVWSFPRGEPRHVFDHQVHAVLAPDGRWLATVDRQHRVQLVDLATRNVLWNIGLPAKRLLGLACSPDGTTLLAGGTGSLHSIDPVLGRALTIAGSHEAGTIGMRFTRDGKHLITSGADGSLKVWSTRGWTVQRTILGANGVAQIAPAPDGQTFAVSVAGAVLTFALSTGKLVGKIEIPLKGIYGVAISPDARWLAVTAADGRVRVWPR